MVDVFINYLIIRQLQHGIYKSRWVIGKKFFPSSIHCLPIRHANNNSQCMNRDTCKFEENSSLG